MANETKYQRQTKGFDPRRESLAFAPKDAGADTLARDRANNTKTLLGNYQRQGDADLISMDLAYKQQTVIDEHNAKVSKQTAEWHGQDLAAFSGLLQYGVQHMAARDQKKDVQQSFSDFLELKKNPELLEKVLVPYRNNVKLNDDNVRKMEQLAFTLESGGEELALVKRVLNNGGFYNHNMLRLMKADIIEKTPEWAQQNLQEKITIPDHVFPGITEPISIEDIEEGGEYNQELIDKDPDNSVLAYMNAQAQKKITDVLSQWYSPEAVMEDFQPVLTAYFGDRDLKGGINARKFWNNSVQKQIRAVLIKEANNLKPTEFVYNLLKDVEAQAPYMKGRKEAFQTKLNQLLVAYENGEITLGKLRKIEEALINSQDHNQIGFEGFKEFKEWRKDNFDYVNWDNRIDARVIAAGKEAADKRANAVTNLQGQMAEYIKVNKGKAPPIELITEWGHTLIKEDGAGGLSIHHLVEKATENMSTQQGDTFEQMKKDLTAAASQTDGISYEVAANYPPEIRDWLEEEGMLLDPAYEINESNKKEFNDLLKGLVAQSMDQEGEYDRPLTKELIERNGEAWLRNRYTQLRKSNVPEGQAIGQATKELQALFEKDINKWMVFKSSDTRTQDLTTSASNEWQRNGFSFDSPLTALEDRLEGIAVHLRSGGRIHKDLVYKADDGNHYKVFDDTLTQLAAKSGKTQAAILKEQLEGMGINISLAGEFQYLNADKRTQYIMERGGSGQIRAKVNASIKDSHLEKLEINQDGGKNFYGIPMARLNDNYLEEATGISAEYLNTVEEGGFKGVMDKLGIKQHELLKPEHVKLIQKRVLSEHGGIPFGVVDTEETGQASFTYNADEANLTPGLSSSFKNDFNLRHFEPGTKLTYATASDRGTPIGATKPANFKIPLLQKEVPTLVFGPISGGTHLGWRFIDGAPDWVKELAKTQGKFYE